MDRNKIAFGAMNVMVIGLLAVLLANLITIQLVYPNHKLTTADRTPVFMWIGMQSDFTLSLDDNKDFSSPVTAKVDGNSYAFPSELGIGTYYWKVESGPFSSGTGKFTVMSSVVVSRNESNLKNEGNVPLSVQAPSITGAFVLGVEESIDIGAEENVKAEQA
ncbi:MAG: hypothetical protein NTU57_04925 [Candidatus Aenigmarchaeota archaeon]|nr:hypothetical protein [Candidatus Aenigmarchaeota archaeon]